MQLNRMKEDAGIGVEYQEKAPSGARANSDWKGNWRELIGPH
jgi:hypothetical protein